MAKPIGISKQRMLNERVARFTDLKPTHKAFLDCVVEGHERDIFQIIGPGVNEDPAHRPAILDHPDFSLGLIRAEDGHGASLHIHDTVEVFMPLEGKWTLYWLDEAGERQEAVLEQHDVISVPVGVWRGFRNDSGHAAHMIAINGGSDPGRVTWPPALIAKAEKKGYKLDGKGNLQKVASAAE